MTREEEVVWEGGRPESGSGCVKPDLLSVWADARSQLGTREGREETNIHPREGVGALGASHVAGREERRRVEGSA